MLAYFFLNGLLLFRNLMFLQGSLPFSSCVQRGVEIWKEQKPCKKRAEVELQHCFGGVVMLCSEGTQVSWEGPLYPTPSRGTLSDVPMSCQTPQWLQYVPFPIPPCHHGCPWQPVKWQGWKWHISCATILHLLLVCHRVLRSRSL